MTQLLVVFIILCYSLTLTLSSSVHHKVQPLHSSGNNETCITITVYDLFGDDWGGVKLYIETPKTPVPALSPNCTNNPVIKHICGEKGQYYFMALNGDDELPDFSWEVIWTVEFDANGQLFTGGFNTTMVFDYSDHMWSLIHHQNIWENEQNLISCSSSQDLSSEHCASEPYHSSPNAPVSNKGQRQSSKNKKSAAPVAGKMIGKIHRGLEAEKNGRRDISTTKAPKRAAVVVSAPKARVNIKDGSEEEFSNVPTFTPTFIPTFEPTFMPTFEPTFMPTFKPSPAPSPTNMTRPPTGIPSGQPTDQPSGQPSGQPTGQPTGIPTSHPTKDEEGGRKEVQKKQRQKVEVRVKNRMSIDPDEFTSVPTFTPTFIPTFEPTFIPTFEPTFMPTFKPSPAPSPTNMTRPPTGIPSGQPTDQPSGQPTDQPSGQPSGIPSSSPTSEDEIEIRGGVDRNRIKIKSEKVRVVKNKRQSAHEQEESFVPTFTPTFMPSFEPTHPTFMPTVKPSPAPSPTNMTRPPTGIPSGQPSDQPSGQPTGLPTSYPTEDEEGGINQVQKKQRQKIEVRVKNKKTRADVDPVDSPTFVPTFTPTWMPTFEPTHPTFMPTVKPSPAPSPTNMTRPPTGIPSGQPTDQPSGQPTGLPTSYPTEDEEGGGEAAVMRKKIRRERQRIEIRKKIAGGESESDEPTVSPTPIPTVNPTYLPTTRPTVLPTFKPSPAPSPTNMTRPPTGIPSGQPTDQPSGQPSGQPSAVPTTEIENEAVRSPVREKPKIMKFERTLKKAKPTKAVESPSPVELKVTMSSPCGDGWFDKHYEGTMFHIADESKKELIAYGTLASGSYLGYCEYCFGEGSYYFRVTADHQCHDAKWSFCGTTGSYSEQLSFHIEDGECIPDALVDLEMICKESYSSVVIVSGKLALTGFSSEIFSKKDKYVIAQALSMTVPGWDTDNIVIEHLNLNFRISKQNERSLLPFTLEVSFEVSFVPEIAYEYESTSYSGIEELVEKLKDILVDATSYGEFSSNLRSSASSAGDRQLATIRGTELLELDLMDVIYVGTKHMYHIDTDEDLETTDNSLRYFSTVMSEMTTDNTFHQVILVAILAVGLVSFMGATVYSLRARRYEDLISKFVDPSESEHGSSFLTKSKKPLVNNLVGVGCDAR